MAKTTSILLAFLLGTSIGGGGTSPSLAAAADPQLRQAQQPQQKSRNEQPPKTQIRTLMCTTESCTDATPSTPGCKKYDTPLDECYNAATLFPGDESWSDTDIYDTMLMRNLKRTFYESKDGTCAGREEEESGGAPVVPGDEDDAFILPFDACVGPFGPPRPWGKFTLMGDDNDQEGEALSEE
mmetsp:Transcript_27783/g.59038  ORF Transcript_27783/g.59038 Transcript_27783/m.59038 type:complete len:183 (-) Transcript_27783:78-626(-)